MTLSIEAQPVPLKQDADGVVRVGDTRVTLEIVIGAYEQGATAETIVQQYSSLRLSDVYAVIAYYLSHRDEVDGYLREAQREAEELRGTIEASTDLKGIRERLLSRRPTSP